MVSADTNLFLISPRQLCIFFSRDIHGGYHGGYKREGVLRISYLLLKSYLISELSHDFPMIFEVIGAVIMREEGIFPMIIEVIGVVIV